MVKDMIGFPPGVTTTSSGSTSIFLLSEICSAIVSLSSKMPDEPV